MVSSIIKTEQAKTTSLCGAVSLLAAIFDEDLDRLKSAYGLPPAKPRGNPCLNCGNPTLNKSGFCSRKCHDGYSWITLACDECGRLFKRHQSEIISRTNRVHPRTGKFQQRWFCSHPCSARWLVKNTNFGHYEYHHGGAPRKWDYEQIRGLREEGYKLREIVKSTGIPFSSLYHILYRQSRN